MSSMALALWSMSAAVDRSSRTSEALWYRSATSGESAYMKMSEISLGI